MSFSGVLRQKVCMPAQAQYLQQVWQCSSDLQQAMVSNIANSQAASE